MNKVYARLGQLKSWASEILYEIPAQITGFGFVAVLIYWIILAVAFLRIGELPSVHPGIFYLKKVGLYIHWLEHPQSWTGLHVIVIWVLDILGPGLGPLAFGIVMKWALLATTEPGNINNVSDQEEIHSHSDLL